MPGVCLDRVDPHRQANDPDYTQTRHLQSATVQRVSLSEHVAATRDRRPAGGQRLLHVSSQYQPYDQSSRLLTSQRLVPLQPFLEAYILLVVFLW